MKVMFYFYENNVHFLRKSYFLWKCLCYVIFYEMFVLCYFLWNVFTMLFSMKCLCYVIFYEMLLLCYFLWNVCAMLFSMKCLCYVIFYEMFVLCYFLWNVFTMLFSMKCLCYVIFYEILFALRKKSYFLWKLTFFQEVTMYLGKIFCILS